MKKTPKLEITYPGKIRLVRTLPEEAMMALTWYMAIDGEAWEIPPGLQKMLDKADIYTPEGARKVKASLKNHLPYFRKKYGKTRMGLTLIPTKILTEKIYEESNEIRKDHKSFKEYHQWYLDALPRYHHNTKKPLWPVILSNHKGETLQDGWGRFHHYVKNKVQNIPAIYYPKSK